MLICDNRNKPGDDKLIVYCYDSLNIMKRIIDKTRSQHSRTNSIPSPLHLKKAHCQRAYLFSHTKLPSRFCFVQLNSGS